VFVALAARKLAASLLSCEGMRLGELLVADGRLTAEQIEQGLHAQVLWGGRLGTNLVELGLLDLDELSWALARLHRIPVALARHFTRLDPLLQQRLGAALAEKWQCVPLTKLSDDPLRIGIAVTTPLSEQAVEEIAAQLGESTEAIVVAVAAEMRILYHLELDYGVGRPARYMRTRDGDKLEPPPTQFGDSSEAELELLPPQLVEVESPLPPPPALALVTPALAGGEVATGPEHRRYMPMMGEPERAVARMAIRRLQVYAGDESPASPASWPDALRAIRRAHDRDVIGELAVTALTSFCPGLQMAALLVVRGAVAIGWRGCRRDGALDVRSIAIPLDRTGDIAIAVDTREVVLRRDVCSGSELDRQLAVALGSVAAAQVVVSPILLSEGRVACVLYCHLDPEDPLAPDDPGVHPHQGPGQLHEADAAGAVIAGQEVARETVGSELVRIASVVGSMRSAFLRLIRAASR
jgi:hypothetical protein